MAKGWLGVSVLDIPQAGSAAFRNPLFATVARRYQGDGAMVTAVSKGSPAEAAGLQRGDVIQEVNREAVKSLDDYQKAAHKIKKDELAVLLVSRQGNSLFVAVNPK